MLFVYYKSTPVCFLRLHAPLLIVSAFRIPNNEIRNQLIKHRNTMPDFRVSVVNIKLMLHFNFKN